METAPASLSTPDLHAVTGPAEICLPLKPRISDHGRITAVSMMKDEGPYVLEWVAHHLAIGFTDLVVYTNDCSDGTDAMLIRLEALGLVHHRRNIIRPGIKPQPSAIKHAQTDPVVCASDWVMVCDADEFLCIRQGCGTLDSLLDATKDAGANGVVITWRIYGSGGVQRWSPAPVTEQYQHAAPPMWNKGWGVKTLFRFDPDYWKLGIHRPKIKNKHLTGDFPHSVNWLNGSGRPMEEYFKFRGWRSIVRTVGYDWVQMNHYAVKSMDSYAIRKLRGNVNNKTDKYNAAYWALQDRNEVHDPLALRHSARRRAIFDQLLTDPTLARLHANAIAKTIATLDRFKAGAAYDSLIADLTAASHVPIYLVDAAPRKPRNPQKIAARMAQIESMVATGAGGADTDPYIIGAVDLTDEVPVDVFANAGIDLPADPRIFSAIALQEVTGGKFMRNAARALPGLMQDNDRFLEIGAGVGFLGAVLARKMPLLAITLQEERVSLLLAGAAVWRANGLHESKTRRFTQAPLFDAMDARHDASGLRQLIRDTRCTVLYANDPRLSVTMIARALTGMGAALPRLVITGARVRAALADGSDAAADLTAIGYTRPKKQPLSASLTFLRAPEGV